MIDEGSFETGRIQAPTRGPYDLAVMLGVLITSFAAIVLGVITLVPEDWKIGLLVTLGSLLFLNFMVTTGWLTRIRTWWTTKEFAGRIRQHPDLVQELAVIARECRLYFAETNRADSIQYATDRMSEESFRLSSPNNLVEVRELGELEGLRQPLALFPQWWAPVEGQVSSMARNPLAVDSYLFQRCAENLGNFLREGVARANQYLQRARQCTWFKPVEYVKDSWNEFAGKANGVAERFASFTKRVGEVAKVEVGFSTPRVKELR